MHYRNKVLKAPRLNHNEIIVTDSSGAVYKSTSERFEFALANSRPEDTFVAREVIPIELKALGSRDEKNYRDRVVLRLLDTLLSYYEKTLLDIMQTWSDIKS